MEKGVIKWFERSKGVGFIKLVNGQELFLRAETIQHCQNIDLNEGDLVELEVDRDQGEFQIKSINRI